MPRGSGSLGLRAGRVDRAFAQVFAMPSGVDMARMLRDDRASARAAWVKQARTAVERKRCESSECPAYVNGQGRYRDSHSFRHLFASLLARTNVPVKTAMELLGHKTVSRTLVIRSHVLLPDQAAAIENALAGASSWQDQRPETASATG